MKKEWAFTITPESPDCPDKRAIRNKYYELQGQMNGWLVQAPRQDNQEVLKFFGLVPGIGAVTLAVDGCVHLAYGEVEEAEASFIAGLMNAGTTYVMSVETGPNTSPGGQLRAKYGTVFDDYMHFRNQGFTPAQAKYLAQPYGARMGHHFPIPRRMARTLGLPDGLVDSQFNVLRPNGMSLGRFYELHYRVDPFFNYAKFPTSVGGGWNGNALRLQRYTGVQRIWHATPGPTKVVVVVCGGSGVAGAGAGTYWWFSGQEEE